MLIEHIFVVEDSRGIGNIRNGIDTFFWNIFQILGNFKISGFDVRDSFKIRNIHQHIGVDERREINISSNTDNVRDIFFDKTCF